MNIRFYNARIMTMENDLDIFEGELWVSDGKVSYAGPAKSMEDIKGSGVGFDREIDVKRNLIMPGFKNAHTHSGMTGLRSFADDLPLSEWLENMIFPTEAKMSADDIAEFSKLAVMEYLTSGITACFDMYMQPFAVAKVFDEMGFRLVQCGDINKFGPTVEEMENRFLNLNNKYPLSSYVMGFHAEYTCTRELLESISELSHKYKIPVWTHNSETKNEVLECINRYGITPTQLFDEIGLYDFGGGGFHCVWMDDKDLEIFKKRGLSAVSNPGSNAKLASGIADITSFLRNGINVALGTDGPSSNNCLDMFREMFLVTALGKIREENAAAVPATEVIKMATVNGAKAMGLNDCDSLAVGKEADLIIIDLKQPNMQPIHNIPVNLVYSGSKQNVYLTMVHGKILYEDGKFNIGFNTDEIYDNVEKITRRICS